MFGKFAFKFLFCTAVFAAQKGTVTAEKSDIYQRADFDSPVIATVQKGEIFDISDKTTGPFYRIRLKDKRLGWISDVDIKSGKTKIKKDDAEKQQPLQSHQEQKKLENKFIVLRYQGLRYELLNWRDKTMGKTRQDQLETLGWAWTGTSTLIDGPFYMDSSFTVAWQAPGYYEKVTGVKTTGSIIRLQTALFKPFEWGEKIVYSYGIGPSLTYANFKSDLIDDNDVYMGVVFPFGLAYRFGNFSAQLWYRYFFEKNQTSSLGFGLTRVF